MGGGCACGAVRFEVRGKPRFEFICQCRDCQRASGTGHAALVVFVKESSSVTGELSFHSTETSSRGFCPACGSPVINESTRNAEIHLFHAAAFDDPSYFRPRTVVFTESGQPWDTPTAAPD